MINNYIKTNEPDLVIDPKSGAVLNINNTKLEEYKRQKKYNGKIKNSFERIEKLEEDMLEIKQLLKTILLKVE